MGQEDQGRRVPKASFKMLFKTLSNMLFTAYSQVVPQQNVPRQQNHDRVPAQYRKSCNRYFINRDIRFSGGTSPSRFGRYLDIPVPFGEDCTTYGRAKNQRVDGENRFALQTAWIHLSI